MFGLGAVDTPPTEVRANLQWFEQLVTVLADKDATKASLTAMREELNTIISRELELDRDKAAFQQNLAEAKAEHDAQDADLKKREEALAGMQALSADTNKRIYAVEQAEIALSRKDELAKVRDESLTARTVAIRDLEQKLEARQKDIEARWDDLKSREAEYKDRLAKLQSLLAA